ncbi:hypothetical protein GCM10011414_23930 [Croceivirga lutea]|uniref:hypothetical protein n=1 Tax=Croceivirga lutea TaxID=1775167 RepID=UPI0016398C58|nr:hypothetical protein [Croceivirga lutea]GGG53474.1 hypothetical protein GCM10011414_23930 [Croceivirga lutea]
MKPFKILLTITALSFFITTTAQETITNESVVQMVELGFDDYMIMDKINTSDVKFDASIAALGDLKKAGVSSEVISLIMEKSKQNTKSKTGIYFVNEDGEDKLIQPAVFSGNNSNRVAQVLVSGLINSKEKARLPNTVSNNVIRTTQPEFTFKFNPATTEVDNLQTNQGSQAGLLNWWFRVASNPNEFVLVKLKVREKQNLREVITGKSNWLSSNEGIDPKLSIRFDIEEIEGNVFKVTPTTLEPGEYCFIYQGQVPQGRQNQSVFDFSIQ